MRGRCGIHDGFPRRPAAGDRRADRRFRHRLHLALGIVSALYQRNRTGRGQRVLCAMQDGVLNLARVKLRDQQRLKHGPLTEYSQYGEGIPSAKRFRAPAMTRAVASPHGCSNAKVGRPIPTPISTSSPRRRCGPRFAI
jgi:formyl-CoA transferase